MRKRLTRETSILQKITISHTTPNRQNGVKKKRRNELKQATRPVKRSRRLVNRNQKMTGRICHTKLVWKSHGRKNVGQRNSVKGTKETINLVTIYNSKIS